jgi:hypothetical protein
MISTGVRGSLRLPGLRAGSSDGEDGHYGGACARGTPDPPGCPAGPGQASQDPGEFAGQRPR